MKRKLLLGALSLIILVFVGSNKVFCDSFEYPTVHVTNTYPDSNILSYTGEELVYEPTFSDVYDAIDFVKNTRDVAVDTQKKLKDVKKIDSDIFIHEKVNEDSYKYIIGVGPYAGKYNKIGISYMFSSGAWGGGLCFFYIDEGTYGCMQVPSEIYDSSQVVKRRVVLTMEVNLSEKDLIFSSNNIDNKRICAKNYLDDKTGPYVGKYLAAFDSVLNETIRVGSPVSFYKITITMNDGTKYELTPARKLSTVEGTRKWSYGMFSDIDNNLQDTVIVTDGTEYGYDADSIFAKYTVHQYFTKQDGSKDYGTGNDIPVIDKTNSKAGFYNTATKVFTPVTDKTIGPEDTDIFRYEGTTRATDPGEYKCKTVLSSLGKALGLQLSNTEERTWYIKTTIDKPTLASSELTYDEGNKLFPQIKYTREADKNFLNIVDTATNKAPVGYSNVSEHSIKFSLKNKTLYSWSDGTQDDFVLDWKIVPKDIDQPILANVPYKYTGSAINTDYCYSNQGQSFKINGTKHVSNSIYDINDNPISKCYKVGIYKQVLNHDTNTKWTGIPSSSSDSAAYYFAIYDNYLNFTLDNTRDELKNALLSVAEKSLDDSKIAMWASCESLNNDKSKKDLFAETAKQDSIEVANVFDIKVYKELNYERPNECNNTTSAIKMSIDMPSNIKDPSKVKLYRYHNGTVEELTPTITNNRMQFESDKFSYYAVCGEVKKESPKSKPKGGRVVVPNTGIYQ